MMGLFDLFRAKKILDPVVPPSKVTITRHEPTVEDYEQQREDKRRELRRLEKASLPSERGLKPHEIALLAAAPNYKTSGNSFPKMWYYEYAIDDPQAMLNMLLEKGFIRVASASESLQKLADSICSSVESKLG